MLTKAISVGIHSQTLLDENGFVAGSEITTGCLENAFLKRSDIDKVYRFSPNNYVSISEQHIDLIIIEGWHPVLPQFISLFRSSHPEAIILFWNLSFLGFSAVIQLDVDGYLSNSLKNTAILNKIKPTRHLLLAADSDLFHTSSTLENIKHEVVYLGMFHLGKSEEIEQLILHEALPFDFSIYGAGWDNHTVLRSNWKGKLPLNDIPTLYSSSRIVLGMTEDRQRRAGMINNRVFEALSCGVFFISEYFPALEHIFGDLILYSHSKGDTTKHIQSILNGDYDAESQRQRSAKFIQDNHTYEHRIEEILDFYTMLINT
jgi:spore maturation protein CgeB